MMDTHKGNNNAQMNDSDLIRSFQSGDRIAFDLLVRKHMDRIFNLCFRFTGDFHEAEDLAQDIFFKVFKSLNRFRFESSFSTWLYRVSVNACMNRLRSLDYRRKKKKVRFDTVTDRVDDDQTVEFGHHSETAVTELQRKERMKSIQMAIDSLPLKQKSLIVLRDIQGLSYEEITRITGVKPGTLKSRLARARLTLKEKLRGVI